MTTSGPSSSEEPHDDITLSVQDLEERWDPIKKNGAKPEEHEPVRIRLHRCFSWMQRVADLDGADLAMDDARLIDRWIAFNSLYGCWNADEREPVREQISIDAFLRRLLQHDAEERIMELLVTHRDLVRTLLGDEYLNKFFWQDPGEDSARRANNFARKMGGWYHDRRTLLILEPTLQRVYLARCQLVHGASTFGSRMNRQALKHCARFMELFLPAACVIIIDHAWTEDWSDLCYPPIK